jgi:hypothetical protein
MMNDMLKEFEEKYPKAFAYEARKPYWLHVRVKTFNLNASKWLKIKCFVYFLGSLIKYYLGLTKKRPVLVSFGCGDGWKPLVEEVAKELNEHDTATFAQVKEKFGMLRIYLDGGDKDLRQKISKLEFESGKMCEECGSKENVKTEGSCWIKTHCDDCREKINKDRI